MDGWVLPYQFFLSSLASRLSPFRPPYLTRVFDFIDTRLMKIVGMMIIISSSIINRYRYILPDLSTAITIWSRLLRSVPRSRESHVNVNHFHMRPFHLQIIHRQATK